VLKPDKYLALAAGLVTGYRYPQPFSLYLKGYFRANKQHGSRDRRAISMLCYSFFRLGKNLPQTPVDDKILLGLWLTENAETLQPWMPFIAEKWSFVKKEITTDKLSIARQHIQEFSTENLFPFSGELSALSNSSEFYASLLGRPLVWVRVKRDKTGVFKKIADEQGIAWQAHPQLPNAFGLPHNTDVEKLLGGHAGPGRSLHQIAEIQDASSQLTGNIITTEPYEKVWDCCCGAGGKSLMLADKYPAIQLHSSDVRPAIIHNLHNRFKEAGEKPPYTATVDITTYTGNEIKFERGHKNETIPQNGFDIIVADVPCSGSGTWARTPEQACFFTRENLEKYTALQRKIVMNAARFLKPGGRLYYITCSVYKAENENQLEFFSQNGFTVKEQYLIEGWHHKADSMFIACLVK